MEYLKEIQPSYLVNYKTAMLEIFILQSITTKFFGVGVHTTGTYSVVGEITPEKITFKMFQIADENLDFAKEIFKSEVNFAFNLKGADIYMGQVISGVFGGSNPCTIEQPEKHFAQ